MYRHKEWDKELICSVLWIYFPANFKFIYALLQMIQMQNPTTTRTQDNINLGLQTVWTDLFHKSVYTRIKKGPPYVSYLQNCSSADWDPYEA
jgi:hypothetical protein